MTTLQAERLLRSCERLRLRVIPSCYEALSEEAAAGEWTYVDYLERLLEEEAAARQERAIAMKTRMAHFPFLKTLDQFDFSFQPSLDRKLIKRLGTLRFVEERENVIFLGPPGVGKTHLAIALGLEAVKANFSVYFATLQDLLSTLARARAQDQLEAKLRGLTKPKLLIIDEVGYLPLDGWEARMVFQLVSQRYERGSIILTSNKSYGDWGEIFPDQVMAAAILDRLLHHSTTVNIKGESYRLREKRRAGLVGRAGEVKRRRDRRGSAVETEGG
jgi:DNA replication protein DnaC